MTDRLNWKPGTMVYPLPAVMVSCGSTPEQHNIITIAWTGTIATNPPTCYVSIRKSRYSHQIIKQTGEFVINLTNAALAKQTDWCGVKSGRDYNKFQEMKLTPVKAQTVAAPIIGESPLAIECKVLEIKEMGSHDMFIAEVLNVSANNEFFNPDSGEFDLEKAKMLAYSHGFYYELGQKIGKFGFSVRKKKHKKARWRDENGTPRGNCVVNPINKNENDPDFMNVIKKIK